MRGATHLFRHLHLGRRPRSAEGLDLDREGRRRGRHLAASCARCSAANGLDRTWRRDRTAARGPPFPPFSVPYTILEQYTHTMLRWLSLLLNGSAGAVAALLCFDPLATSRGPAVKEAGRRRRLPSECATVGRRKRGIELSPLCHVVSLHERGRQVGL